MTIRARKSFKFGPLHLNFTLGGFTSWSVKIGPWSWNSRARRQRVDLPGPLYWIGKRRGGGSR